MRRLYNGILAGVIGFAYGQGVTQIWPEWSSWTWWSIGTVLLPLFVVPTLWNNRKRILESNTYQRAMADIGRDPTNFPVFVGIPIIAAFLVWQLATHEPLVWSHPTLSQSEQEQAHAKCEMEAMASVDRLRRWEYEKTCLISRGFEIDNRVKETHTIDQ